MPLKEIYREAKKASKWVLILGALNCLSMAPAWGQGAAVDEAIPAPTASPEPIASPAENEALDEKTPTEGAMTNTGAESAAAETAETPAPAVSAPAPAAPASSETRRFSLSTARDETHTKPVFYESMDNLLPTMEFEYDLTEKNGTVLRVGDTLISGESFFFALVPVAKFHSRMTAVVGAKEAAKMALVLRWPEVLQKKGTLEAISRTGKVLWKHEISDAQRAEWDTKLDIWKKGLGTKGVKIDKLPKTSVFSTQYGIIDVGTYGLKAFSESFRFCLTQSEGRAQSRLCSQRYVIRGGGRQMSLARVKSTLEPRVLLRSQPAPLKQDVPVPRDQPTAFFAELAGGESYEFIATPNKLNLMDLTDTKNPAEIRIMAWGTRPTIPSTILNPDEYSSFIKAIGFQPTIGDMRKFWETTISAEDPKIYLPGQGGGLFTQRFSLSEVPRANARPYLSIHTPVGTYYDGVKIFGKKLPEVKITSFENSVEVDEKDPKYFTWRFKAKDRGEINRSYLSMEYQGKEYKAFYEVYLGFPRELSLRLSGLLQPTGEAVFLGEVSYNQWFENLLGWTNHWVGRHRWGVSGRYFKSLTKLKVNKKTGAVAELSVMNVDLKYRLTPGLWGRDETLGAMLDYQNIEFGRFVAPMVGVGAFWGRSMPKVFDDLFNLMPLLRYPKWVDMEFIYYPVSLDPQVTLRTNAALNFHGKVLWTKRWFGEAGFGVKRYAIADQKLLQNAALNTFYGTVGVGLNF